MDNKVSIALEDLVLLFETLDSDKDGLLSYRDLSYFIEIVDDLKEVQFNLDKFIEKHNSEGD